MESEGYAGAQSAFHGEQANQGGVSYLMERIFSNENLYMAASQVVRNKGAEGIDGMTYDQLFPYMQENWGQLLKELYARTGARALSLIFN
jgi:retron-type reverse transcriptase